ncbi:hypothetical protein ACR79P_19745 [Sphingobacterium spiritivorum]|uniref:hypothetical protein n=1 Tax=Sphingobacterium spiritivorum TaxID=258 RepID=UPI003DA2C7E1
MLHLISGSEEEENYSPTKSEYVFFWLLVGLFIVGGFVGGLLGGEVGGSIGKGAVDMYHDK